MTRPTPSRRLLSCFLAIYICLSLFCPAAALESTEPSLPGETIDPAESVPGETVTEEITAEESASEETIAEDPEPAYVFLPPYHLYFGLLHAHTDISDGLGSVEEAFSHAAAVENLDFFAVTDHSNSFDNADAGALTLDGTALSSEWAAGKAAAAAVTNEDFLGLFGFEMTWPEIRQLGHIVTFRTPGWVSRDQEGFADDPKALQHYFEALAQVPGSVSQFCHPGTLYGDFRRFRDYRADYDGQIHLLEVLGEGSIASYVQALDQYWHLAPTASQNSHNGSWGSENGLRTVILAEELTENGLFDSIRAHRVYATEDADLHLYYTLDGQDMGSILYSADNPEIELSLWDPTDTGGYTVEVITEGGTVLSRTESGGNEDLTISVPGGYRWYFLKITQADGDLAVTAPVWVEGFENIGIAGLTADSQIPVQGTELTVNLELYNEESVPFQVTSLEFYAEDVLLQTIVAPEVLEAGSTDTISVPYTHPHAGTVTLRAVLRGSVLGQEQNCETTLTLRFRPEGTVSGLLIDGCHSSIGPDSLTHFQDLAQEAGMDVTLFTDSMPMGGDLLLIPPMETPPESDFLSDVRVFLETGGSLILLAGPEDYGYENALLEALGSDLRFGASLVPADSATVFNTDSPWLKNLAEGQFFRHGDSRTLEEGGSWLVKDRSGEHILLSCAQTQWGGTIFAAGSPFLLDGHMPKPESNWSLPSANQTLTEAALGIGKPILEQTPIDDVRKGNAGSCYRIKGYVTAGTSDPNTIFPDTIYLQDDTGGIAVTGFALPGIQIGMPMELIGILNTENGAVTLEYVDHHLPEERYFYPEPRELGCKAAKDYSLHGGKLVQLTGTVTALTRTADKQGIRKMTLRDTLGDSIVVEIEETILSGSTGKNTLAESVKKNRTVQVIGLVHRNAAGETVLRVRDCDEVVYIPPGADPTNPQTGDRLLIFW